jgi:formate hydrogenlyase subunit 6/NADH:ubiquinone oxidoreductase subunit I
MKTHKRRSNDKAQQLELPVVDETLCTGCGLCPVVCPTDCLAMHGPLPWLPRPRDCVSCGLCAAICPSTALRLEVPSAA